MIHLQFHHISVFFSIVKVAAMCVKDIEDIYLFEAENVALLSVCGRAPTILESFISSKLKMLVCVIIIFAM